MTPNDQLGELFSRFHAGLRRNLGKQGQLASPELMYFHEKFINPDIGYLLSKPVSDTRFVVIDTETTGFHAYAGDEIISIAMVEYLGFKPTGREFSSFINPGREIPAASTAIHHITDDQVKDAPSMDDALLDIADFLDDSVLVGHHINFDIRFLNKAFRRNLLCQIRQPWVDTMLVYLAVSGRVGHYSLDEVAEFCHLSVRDRHSASGDAHATAEIFALLASHLVKSSDSTATLLEKQNDLGQF